MIRNNPIDKAVELTKEGRSLIAFSDENESFLPKAYLLCSVESIQEAFVKKHKLFTEMDHPFRNTKEFLSPIGFKALRVAGGEKVLTKDVEDLDIWLHSYQKRFFNKLSQKSEAFDLYYELSFLSLNFAFKFLFNYENEAVAKDFLDCSLEFEDFLTQIRRGKLKDSSDEEVGIIKQEILEKQSSNVRVILKSLGVENISAGDIRAFIRTTLNSYVGTATSFFWLTKLLDDEKESKKRLVDELAKIDLSSLEEVENAPILDAFIKESLRLYPSAWMMTRRAMEATSIDSVQIESGEIVHVCLYSLHRDPKYWNEPDLFQLEHFLGKSNHSAFLPFGIGPRRCVGSKYAYYILKLFLTNYVRSFEIDFSGAEKFSPVPQVALQPQPAPYASISKLD